jgi:hypothetical protein
MTFVEKGEIVQCVAPPCTKARPGTPRDLTPDPAEGRANDVMSLIEMGVSRVFAISLILASAKESLGDHPASHRVSEAIDQMDALIRDLRGAAFSERMVQTTETELSDSRHHVIELAETAQTQGPATAELLDLVNCMQRAALQLDSHAVHTQP